MKKRFLLVPHIHGWGHRIRCQTLGAELLGGNPRCRVTIAVRRDDPVDPAEWTFLATTRGRLARTLEIVRASVLVQDGFLFYDLRVRLMKILGGRLVLIVQPTGFSEDRGTAAALRASDLILVPFPEELFEADWPLRGVTQKVRVVPPILSMGPIERDPPSDRLVVCCLVTRPEDGFPELLEECRRLLESRLVRPVEIAGRFGGLWSVEDHVAVLSRAHVVVTQGMTSAFEAFSLGIPVVLVPRSDVPEQVSTASVLKKKGLAECVTSDRLLASNLAESILDAFARPSTKPTLSLNLSGAKEAATLLRRLVGLEPSGPTPRPATLGIAATNYNCAHALVSHLDSIYRQFPEDFFEYIVVDNFSQDTSSEIFREWASTHRNFRWLKARCTRGQGREIAICESNAPYVLTVDTDTVYRPILRSFVDQVLEKWPHHAVQAIYSGIYPRVLLRAIGGFENFNYGEDFELWMRLWHIGRMKWCPVSMGENLKEPGTLDANDFLSARYSLSNRVARLLRSEFDRLRLSRYEVFDLRSILATNTVDLGLGPIENHWFGERHMGSLWREIPAFARSFSQILRS